MALPAAFIARVIAFPVTRRYRSVATPGRKTTVGAIVLPDNEIHATSWNAASALRLQPPGSEVEQVYIGFDL